MSTGVETLRGKSSRRHTPGLRKRKTVLKEFGSKRVIGFKVEDNTRRLDSQSTSYTLPEEPDQWIDDDNEYEDAETAANGGSAWQCAGDRQQQAPSARHVSETFPQRPRAQTNAASGSDRRHAEEHRWQQFREASTDAYLQNLDSLLLVQQQVRAAVKGILTHHAQRAQCSNCGASSISCESETIRTVLVRVMLVDFSCTVEVPVFSCTR